MATIVTINSGDQISNSRADINTNFANLNNDKIETSYLDTDTALAANSDSKIATQKATKAYVDAAAPSLNFKGVRAYQTVATTIGTSDTTVLFNAEQFDTDAFHSTSVNTGRITFPTTGTYLVGGSLRANNNDRGYIVRIVLNGTTIIASNAGGTTGYTAVMSVSVSTLRQFTSGDYIELVAEASTADDSSGTEATNFWAYKVG